jgi:NAD(P)-dependent dehydrogenase (short-subunit alcohol dehydrogenase family)
MNNNTDIGRTKDTSGLAGRVCVVTGAGGGIGRGIAVALAKEGGRIAVLDLNTEGTKATVAEVKARGGEAAAFTCDTSDAVSVARAAAQSAATLGPCDVLVNNAGILRPGALDVLTLDEWNKVLSVNLTGYFLCAQTFGRQMRSKGDKRGEGDKSEGQRGGVLVHIASIAAEHATALAGAYSVTKAGVEMLSRQLAVEWGQHGIRSNTVHPGMILTPMSQAFYDQPGVTERRSQAVPAGRIGVPDDIAQAVVFLASDRSAYISGQSLTVDGGFTRMMMGLIPRAGYESEMS